MGGVQLKEMTANGRCPVTGSVSNGRHPVAGGVC